MTENAKRDQNGIATLIGVSNADGVTPLRAYIDSSTNRMLVNATITGTVTVTGAGGASMVDDAAFAVGTDTFTPVGGIFDDVSPDSVNEGDGGAFRMSGNRNLYVTIRDAAGNERGLNVAADGSIAVTFSGTVTVDNAGTFAVQVDGAALTALQLIDDIVKTDDAAFTPGTDKVAMVGAEFDDTTPDSVDEGDAGALRMSSRRELYIQLRDAAGNERGLVIDANGEIQISGSRNAIAVTMATNTPVGNVAHDSADSGAPIKVGAKAESSPKGITLVADGDRTDLYSDLDGQQIVKIGTSGADLISERISNTDGSSTAFTNFSAVASTYNYIIAYSIFRTDAGTTPIYVDFKDGTAGSILWSVVIPPNGGANLASAIPLFKTSANTALAYDVSAATTTVYISITGFQSKV